MFYYFSTSGTSKLRIKEKLKLELAILTGKVTSKVTQAAFSGTQNCIRRNHWPSAQDSAVITVVKGGLSAFKWQKSQVAPTL